MKQYLKETYKLYIYTLIILLILLFPMPYFISNGGGVDNLDKKINVEGGYKGEGSFNLSYVNELEGTVASYIMSYIMPSWDREKVNDYMIIDNESVDDVNNRGKVSLYQSNDNSTLVAYTKAGKKIEPKENNYYIYIIFNENIKNIKVGDKLYKVNGLDNPDFDVLKDIIDKEDKVTITVLRDDKEITEEINVFTTEEGNRYIGLTFMNIVDYETDPKIEFVTKDNESGGSAGLMMSLAIYNALTEYDYSRGLVVAGTGTISADGTVGEIGGVNYKLTGAVSGGVDIFFVPDGDNYKEALKIKEKNNYKIDLVPVKTFDDAIEYLKNIKK